jgi:hypothetical protein
MTALQTAFSSVPGPFGTHTIEYAMLGSAAGLCLMTGLIVWLLDARAGAEEPVRTIADGSFATATLVVGLALALLGAGFGLWLILIGAGTVALGAGGVVRETRARRRSYSRASGGGPRSSTGPSTGSSTSTEGARR